MLRIYSLTLFLLTLSCKSSEGGHSGVSSFATVELIPKETDSLKAMAPPLAVVPSMRECSSSEAPVCPAEESSNPYRCVAVKYKGQLLADDAQLSTWADTPCQARLELFKQACKSQLHYRDIDLISCHPDSSVGLCPAVVKACPKTREPTRCFANAYAGQELTWANRPEAWGANNCEARNNLNNKACSLGLSPAELQQVSCETERSTAVCPPVWKECAPQDGEFNECKIARVGEVNLKQALRAVGTNRCEATYRVQELACRFQKSEIKDFSGLECNSFSRRASAPARRTKAQL